MASLFKNPKKWFKSAGKKIKQTVKGAGKLAASPYKAVAKTVGKVVPGVADSYGAIGDAVQGKSLKKAAKKFGKGVKASAPIAAAIAGPAAIGAAAGSAAAGLDNLTGGFLSKAGDLAGNIGDKLGKVQNTLAEFGFGGDDAPTTQLQQTASGEATFNPENSQADTKGAGGMDPKMLLIGGAALVALLVLMRRK